MIFDTGGNNNLLSLIYPEQDIGENLYTYQVEYGVLCAYVLILPEGLCLFSNSADYASGCG